MKLKDVRMERSSDRIRLVADIENAKVKPYLAFPTEMESFVAGTADGFVPMLLVPCLEKGEALEIVPPVSPQMVRRLPRIMDVLLSLFPTFHRVSVKLNERTEPVPPAGSTVASL